jgi:hypothetical protein
MNLKFICYNKLNNMESSLITFVCCPKPFLTEFYDIQNNAIKSWAKLECVNKIIICGNDYGVEEYANTLLKEIDRNKTEIMYIKNIETNEFGTPLVNCLFNIASDNSDRNICYINSDIILLSDFTDTFNAFITQNPRQNDFLIVGQRWDWNNPEKIDFGDKNWEENVKTKSISDGKIHAPSGIDYFLCSKTTFPNMPPFAIGRYWWDNAIVGNAHKRNNVMSIDASKSVFAIHQNSPWLYQGKIENVGNNIRNGIESKRNRNFWNYIVAINTGTRTLALKEQDEIIFKNK